MKMNIVSDNARTAVAASPRKKERKIGSSSSGTSSSNNTMSSFADLYWSSLVKFKKKSETQIRVNIPGTTTLWNPTQPTTQGKGDTVPYLFRKVKGDFQVWVKISGHNFATNGDQAGILLKENNKVYMRCGIELNSRTFQVISNESNNSNGNVSVSTALANHEVWDKSSIPSIATTATGSQKKIHWFSMKRKGNTIISYCSHDGINYKPIRTSHLTDSAGLMVGVYGACPLGDGVKVLYSDFKIKEMPPSSSQNRKSDSSRNLNNCTSEAIRRGSFHGRDCIQKGSSLLLSSSVAPSSPQHLQQPVPRRRTSFRYNEQDEFNFDDDDSSYGGGEFDEIDSDDDEKKQTNYYSDDDDYYYYQRNSKKYNNNNNKRSNRAVRT